MEQFFRSTKKPRIKMVSTTLFNLNIPDTGMPRVVIVGGGFGGINLLRKLPEHYQVVIFDRYNYHTFQPLLYQVATAGIEPDSVAGPLRKIINRKHHVFFRMLSVVRVSPEKQEVHTRIGSLQYDYLVLATGAKTNFFNNQNISRYAFPLKQVSHALDLRSHIFQLFENLEVSGDHRNDRHEVNFVVVGAGPTGVEVCGALSELKKHVLPRDYPDLDISKVHIHLVEGLSRVLPGMSEKSGDTAKRYLEKMGIIIHLNCLTEDYDGHRVKLSNNSSILTDTLIWAAGVKGNLVEGLKDNSIEKGKIRVDRFNRVYSDKQNGITYNALFAIGDIAFMKTENYPKGLPGLAQTAIQQGRHVAKNIVRIEKGAALKPFRYKHKGALATVGRNRAVADLPANFNLRGTLGWLVWMAVHLFSLIGFRNKIIALANWTWNYFTYDRGVRLIIRPSTKLTDPMSKNMQEEMSEINN